MTPRAAPESTAIDAAVYPARMRHTNPALRLMMICVLAVGIAGADAMFDASSSEARPRPTRKKSNFKANKTFGLGIMLGAPTGLSGKYFLGPDTALDFGVGTIYEYRNRRGFHAHVDFLWHPVSLVSAPAFELPLYFGVGGRLLRGDYCYNYDNGRCDYYYDDYAALGVRGPLGIAFDFNRVPLDVFLELAFVFDFVVDRDRDRADAIYVDINGAFGIRYYFN